MLFANRRRARAFTLIELLTAIVVVTVLAAILLPLFRTSTAVTQRTKCLANMKQIIAATLLFTGDNEGAFPIAENPSWDVSLAPYLGQNTKGSATSVFKCPADARAATINGKFTRSYTVNAVQDQYGVCGHHNAPSRRMQNLSTPALTIVVAEWFHAGNCLDDDSYSYLLGNDSWPTTYPRNADGTCYHLTGTNFAFADGHVASMTPAEAKGAYWQASPP